MVQTEHIVRLMTQKLAI